MVILRDSCIKGSRRKNPRESDSGFSRFLLADVSVAAASRNGPGSVSTPSQIRVRGGPATEAFQIRRVDRRMDGSDN